MTHFQIIFPAINLHLEWIFHGYATAMMAHVLILRWEQISTIRVSRSAEHSVEDWDALCDSMISTIIFRVRSWRFICCNHILYTVYIHVYIYNTHNYSICDNHDQPLFYLAKIWDIDNRYSRCSDVAMYSSGMGYSQREFQDPKMQVLYHIMPDFLGRFLYIGLEIGLVYGRCLQSIGS